MGFQASKFDPAVMPGPPRAHMHATDVPVGVSGVAGFPAVSSWTDVTDGVVVDMQAEEWGK